MKSPIRILLLVVAAVLCCPLSHSQPAPQDQQGARFGGGMAEMQAHSIRGDITAISGNTLTVKTEEGDVYSVTTGPNTRFRKQRDEIKLSDLQVGDMVGAFGDKDANAKTLGAAFVVVMDKARYEQMRAEFGKTWTAGVVQSIAGTNITIKRPDNVTQTISVNENTSFRRRREDITLLDIKPGDNINARGSLQNGTFVATEVNIGRAGGFRRGPAPDAQQPSNR